MPDDDWALGQNTVDVRNEARRSSHYEISPREREDEQRRHRDEFDDDLGDFSWVDLWVQKILDEKREADG